MEDNSTQALQQQTSDLSDADCSTIDTSYPKIVAQTYLLRVKDVEIKENNAQTGKNMSVDFETITDALSTTGEPVPPGFVLYRNISLVKTAKYDPNKAVASFMKCFSIPGSPRSLVDGLGRSAIGQPGYCNVVVKKGTPEFPEKNDIRDFVVK